MKHIQNIAQSLAICALAFCVSACSTSMQAPLHLTHSSTDGTPVAARLSASDHGFRFLGLGSDASTLQAVNNLYANVSMSGRQILNNNYAFQNMLVERETSFLFPFLGSETITVCADLYAYTNNDAPESNAEKSK